MSTIIPYRGYDYVMPSNPTISSNPDVPFVNWLNSSTGALFICIDNTIDANVWIEQIQQFRGALVYKTADQTLTNGVSEAQIWDAETYDTDGFHDNVTNNSRLTIPAGISKVKLIANLNCKFEAENNISWRHTLNASSFIGGGSAESNGLGAYYDWRTNGSSAVIDVVAGDYFEVYTYSVGSGTKYVASGTYSWFSIEVIE